MIQLVEIYLGKPGLVRETSRVGTLGSTVHRLRLLAKRAAGLVGGKAGKAHSAEESWSLGRGLSGRVEAVHAFRDVVLIPDLKEQVLLVFSSNMFFKSKTVQEYFSRTRWTL